MGKGFNELRVWIQAKDFAVKIYKRTLEGEISKDFSFRDQIRRSAVSVASNIAEGDERNTDKEAVMFFYIAKGSLAELRTQICIASEIGYLSSEENKSLEQECIALGRMLGSLIKFRGGRGKQA